MFIKSSGDQTTKNQIYKPGMLVPVFSAGSLLNNKRHQFLLHQLATLSLLMPEQQQALYETLVHRFVEFVQVLPTQPDDPLCSLMTTGLLRGINSLNHYVQNHPEATALERYAIFSTGLLVDVANVVVNQKIFITDEEGNFVKQWNPFTGSLTEAEATYYKIMPLSTTYQRNIHSITPILAQQLLPKEGFLWLTSDLRIFSDWLEALRGDEAEGAGRFTHTIQLFKHKGAEGLFNNLPMMAVDLHESPATAHADTFLTWLKKGLETQQIKVNTSDAGVHVTPEGVFLEKAGIFKQYIDLHVDIPVNLFTIYQQFGNLFGLTKLSGIDYRFDQLFSEYPDFAKNKFTMGFASPNVSRMNSIREGVLIADPNLIFTRGEIPSATPYLKPLPNAERPQSIPSLKSLNVTPKIK